VVTLALFGQWARCTSERDCSRSAEQRVRGAFPPLPHRAQVNRRIRAERDVIVAVGQHLAAAAAGDGPVEVLDGAGVAVRNSTRRERGWLPEYAGIGRCSRLGWYAGVHLLVAAPPDGVITGYGYGSAEVKDQPLGSAPGISPWPKPSSLRDTHKTPASPPSASPLASPTLRTPAASAPTATPTGRQTLARR
jgi:hypothetical protein